MMDPYLVLRAYLEAEFSKADGPFADAPVVWTLGPIAAEVDEDAEFTRAAGIAANRLTGFTPSGGDVNLNILVSLAAGGTRGEAPGGTPGDMEAGEGAARGAYEDLEAASKIVHGMTSGEISSEDPAGLLVIEEVTEALGQQDDLYTNTLTVTAIWQAEIEGDE